MPGEKISEMKMRHKTFGENFILVEKILRQKCKVKHLKKILYLEKKFVS